MLLGSLLSFYRSVLEPTLLFDEDGRLVITVYVLKFAVFYFCRLAKRGKIFTVYDYELELTCMKFQDKCSVRS